MLLPGVALSVYIYILTCKSEKVYIFSCPLVGGWLAREVGAAFFALVSGWPGDGGWCISVGWARKAGTLAGWRWY